VETPDGEAVRQVLAGDVEAFRHLVTRYRQQFARHAVALVGDADAAADAMQEAFVRAYDSLASCREPDRFGSWFYRILTNQCHTARERMRDAEPIEAVELAARERTDAPLERAELAQALESALGRLTAEQREAFIMKHVDGRSYEEMAEVLGTGVDALKMRVYRAREALRQLMGAMR
jgi:RNA polymerase sigma-70 factor (ECF subfamily)